MSDMDQRTIAQIRNTVALVTWAINPRNQDLDAAAEDIVHDLSSDGQAYNVAGFVGVANALLDRLAEVTGRPRDDVWQEIVFTLTSNIEGDQHHG